MRSQSVSPLTKDVHTYRLKTSNQSIAPSSNDTIRKPKADTLHGVSDTPGINTSNGNSTPAISLVLSWARRFLREGSPPCIQLPR
ncbi:hypothetical protein BC826DRAFT_1016215 [Russula brevipes]|nr:hypothetical protein BC826DRAFT_1016215 [Russula brevipes]